MAENGSVDRLTELPIETIHHIMSFLPTPDLFRAGLCSKSLMSDFKCFPILNMDFSYSVSCFRSVNSFMDCINDFIVSTKRYQAQTFPEKFRLQSPTPDSAYRGNGDIIEEAIGFAVKNGVNELDICLGGGYHYTLSLLITTSVNLITVLKLHGLRLALPMNLFSLFPEIEVIHFTNCVAMPYEFKFSSGKLKSICLEFCSGMSKIDVNSPSLLNFTYVGRYYQHIRIVVSSSCSSLKVLSLDCVDVPHGMKTHLAKLVQLESLKLKNCRPLKMIELLDHHKLKTIELIRCTSLASIEIRSVSLESLLFSVDSSTSTSISRSHIRIDACKNLKRLALGGDTINRKFLRRKISKLTSLESLELNSFSRFESIFITHPSIKSLKLLNCNRNIVEVKVNTPSLVSLVYSGDAIPFGLISSEALLDASLSFKINGPRNHYYFVTLKKLLKSFGHSKMLTVVCRSDEDLIFPRKYRHLFASLLDSKHLTIKIEESYLPRISGELVDNLLRLCPNLENLNFDSKGSDRRSIKFTH